jgi:hypothetical protein
MHGRRHNAHAYLIGVPPRRQQMLTISGDGRSLMMWTSIQPHASTA